MDSLDKLKAAIIEQIKARIPVQTVWAECVSADAEAGTMTATADGLEYDDVLLGLGADITVPAPQSKVLLGLVGNSAVATFLLFTEQVQERRLNGNTFGGLVKADTVRSADAALVAKVNALVTALTAWTPTVPTPTLADLATLKAAFSTWSTPMQNTEPTAYENTVVKHG